MDQPPVQTMPQAVQAPNVAGALQSLLLSRLHSPQQAEASDKQRAGALQQYQSSLRQDPYGSYTPTQHGLYSWAGAIGKMAPSAALATGIASGGQQLANQQHGLVQGDISATKVGYEDAKDQDNALNKELSAMAARAAAAKGPSAEHLASLYQSALNAAMKDADRYDFKGMADSLGITPDAAKERWVREYVDRHMQNFINNYAISPTGPRGAGSEPGAVPAPSVPNLTDAGKNPVVSPETALQRSAKERNIPMIQAELAKADPVKDADRIMVLRQELQREQEELRSLGGNPDNLPKTNTSASPAPTAQPPGAVAGTPAAQPPSAMPPAAAQPPAGVAPQPAVPGSAAKPLPAFSGNPTLRNIPKEKYEEKGNQEMAGAMADEYKRAQEQGAAANSQLDAYNVLEKNMPQTGVFTKGSQVLGNLFSALGQDPTSPIIQNAIKSRNAELIIAQLTNASLKAEKGQQTRTDEIRIANEFPQLKDPNQVFQYAVKLGKEKAQRKMEQVEFYDSLAAKNNGVPKNALTAWQNETTRDPLTQYLGGKLIFRTDFLNAFQRKYPGATKADAVAEWRAMEQDFVARGGKK